MGTKFITCLVCFERSRKRKGWYCEACGHMKPSVTMQSLGKDYQFNAKEWQQVKDMSYDQWLEYKGLSKGDASWHSYQLRQYVLPK